MAKTNYSKVETYMEEALRKMNFNNLLKLADAASGKEVYLNIEKEKRPYVLSTVLEHSVKWLAKKDPEAYKKLGMTKKGFQEMLKTPEKEYENLKKLKEKVRALKEEILKELPEGSDESLIEFERERHINKRHNVNDKWLPLK